MKNHYKLLFVLLFLFSCSETKEPFVSFQSDKIELRQLINGQERTSSSYANYFLFWASYGANEVINNKVKVMGLVNGSYRLIEFDLANARIVIDSTVTKPFIIITSNFYSKDKSIDRVLMNLQTDDYYRNKQAFFIYCSEELLPEKLIPINIEK